MLDPADPLKTAVQEVAETYEEDPCGFGCCRDFVEAVLIPDVYTVLVDELTRLLTVPEDDRLRTALTARRDQIAQLNTN